MKSRAKDWLRQAENDLLWAQHSYNSGFYSQACFISQQVAEKALKALAVARGYDLIKSHSVVEIASALSINSKIEAAGKRLDQYYITTRYPDSLPSGAPFEMFDSEQAKEALTLAAVVLTHVQKTIN